MKKKSTEDTKKFIENKKKIDEKKNFLRFD